MCFYAIDHGYTKYCYRSYIYWVFVVEVYGLMVAVFNDYSKIWHTLLQLRIEPISRKPGLVHYPSCLYSHPHQ